MMGSIGRQTNLHGRQSISLPCHDACCSSVPDNSPSPPAAKTPRNHKIYGGSSNASNRLAFPILHYWQGHGCSDCEWVNLPEGGSPKIRTAPGRFCTAGEHGGPTSSGPSAWHLKDENIFYYLGVPESLPCGGCSRTCNSRNSKNL